MFANALRYLYVDEEITDEGLETGLSYLEDYHADKTRKDIEADMNKQVISESNIQNQLLDPLSIKKGGRRKQIYANKIPTTNQLFFPTTQKIIPTTIPTTQL